MPSKRFLARSNVLRAAVPGNTPSSDQRTPAEERRLQKATERQLEDAQYVRVYTGIDRPFLILVLALLAFGIIMGFSASYSYASYKYDDSLYFFKRHLIFAAIGVIAMFLCLYIPIEGFRLLTFPAYGVSIILLLLVLIPGIGRAEGDAQRWLYIPGVGTFQPSELAKLAMVMMMAWYISKNYDKITDCRPGGHPFLWGFCGCCCVFGLIAGLVALEHHISGTVIIGAIGVIMMFVGRVKVKYLALVRQFLPWRQSSIFVSGYGVDRVEVWRMVLLIPRIFRTKLRETPLIRICRGFMPLGLAVSSGLDWATAFKNTAMYPSLRMILFSPLSARNLGSSARLP